VWANDSGVNYDKAVTFLIPNPPTEEEIQEFLTEISISELADL
jgi:hypothetical protein